MLTAKKTLICGLTLANASYALELSTNSATASTMQSQDNDEQAAIKRVQELVMHLAESSAT